MAESFADVATVLFVAAMVVPTLAFVLALIVASGQSARRLQRASAIVSSGMVLALSAAAGSVGCAVVSVCVRIVSNGKIG